MNLKDLLLFFRDDLENYAKTVRRWREDLFLGDHLKIHAKTTIGGGHSEWILYTFYIRPF